jgi:hypothetical protein
MNGGWRTLTDASDQPFANQGRCIAFAIHNPVSLADLANPSFAGTARFAESTNGCPVYGEFDAAYRGSGTVGTVNLHVVGCVLMGDTLSYSGPFSLTTAVGTVTGSANGPIDLSDVNPIFQLTFAVGTATGSFSGMTGTLHFLATTGPSQTFSGMVTVP